MRAQQTNDDLKVAGGQRVPIERTNIVVAEPMPGDKELVAAFAQKFEAPVLGELFRKMVEEMQLAGELGSLLKIDVALNTEIDEAREQFGFWQEQKARALPGTERILAQEGRLFGGIDANTSSRCGRSDYRRAASFCRGRQSQRGYGVIYLQRTPPTG